MTLKQRRLAKELLNPENKTVRDAATKAGYSLKSRHPYEKVTKRYIQNALAKLSGSKEDLQAFFEALSKLAIEKGDLSNANRSAENIARLYSQFVDKQEINQTISDERKQELNRLLESISS